MARKESDKTFLLAERDRLTRFLYLYSWKSLFWLFLRINNCKGKEGNLSLKKSKTAAPDLYPDLFEDALIHIT
jgi:hypothetical protein